MSADSVNLVLRGYRAFMAGDFATVSELLDPEIEWQGLAEDGAPARREEVERVLEERFADGYQIELERCVGKGDDVLMAFRALGVEKDPYDDRPLQTRRTYTIGRYWAIATVRGGRIVRVRDFAKLSAAAAALGIDIGAL